MNQGALRLPVRTLASARSDGGQWLCRRCLATQIETSTPAASPPPSSTKRTSPSPPRIAKDASEAENYDPTLPTSQRDYRLTKTDFYLKKPLPQPIPIQYLQHSTSSLLHKHERAQREKAEAHKPITGVVVSAGKMQKTVKVRVPRMEWNKRIHKHFRGYEQHLVHDPNGSIVEGDVVELHRLRVGKTVRHVVASIVSPFGVPIEDRPPVPTADDRLAAYKEKRFNKLHRRVLRIKAATGDPEAIQELRDMGLDPGHGVEPLKGQSTNTEQGAGERRSPTKGAILGNKGQKLPKGVLSDGTAEVGKINERAQTNKRRALQFEEQTEVNIAEAKEKSEELAKQGIVTGTNLPLQNPVLDPPESSEHWKGRKG